MKLWIRVGNCQSFERYFSESTKTNAIGSEMTGVITSERVDQFDIYNMLLLGTDPSNPSVGPKSFGAILSESHDSGLIFILQCLSFGRLLNASIPPSLLIPIRHLEVRGREFQTRDGRNRSWGKPKAHVFEAKRSNDNYGAVTAR